MKYAVGIDIGGTKISAVVGTSCGKILSRMVIPTLKGRKARLCSDRLADGVADLVRRSGVSKKRIRGIGICIPGAVDPASGKVPKSPHLEGWSGLSLKEIFTRRFRLPVHMNNDANAAAVAEKLFGEGRGVRNFIYITVSTGIGAGIIAGGKLIEGASYVAGEIGHMTVEAKGKEWKMGERGVLEAYSSGTAVACYIREKLKSEKPSRCLRYADENGQITARAVGAAAARKDPLALEAYREAGYYFGIGVGNLLNILNPQKIILGGGMLKSAPSVFWKTFKKTCRERSWKEAFEAVKIVRTKLGDRAGNLGALALVFEKAGG
jgi:glucokinase